MRKAKTLMMVISLCILCSCSKGNEQVKTCTLNRTDALTNIKLTYNDENIIETIQYEFEQVFDEAMVKEMNEVEIKAMLETVFNKNREDGLKAKVQYHKRKRQANITINVKLDDFSEEELAFYDLSQEMEIKKLVKDLYQLGYQCEEK